MDAKVLDVERVVELERAIAAAGTPLAALMERAGTAVADAVRRAVPTPASVVVLAGSGNNGGDGWVAARVLAQAGYPVTIATAKAPEELRAEPARSTALAVEAWAKGAGGAGDASCNANEAGGSGSRDDEGCKTIEAAGSGTRIEPHLRILMAPSEPDVAVACAEARVIVDALLGTGFSGSELRGPMDAWVKAANAARKERGAYVVAADVPSGLSAQTGDAANPTVHADTTVTMLAVKPGLVAPGVEEYVGELECASLEVDVAREFPEFA